MCIPVMLLTPLGPSLQRHHLLRVKIELPIYTREKRKQEWLLKWNYDVIVSVSECMQVLNPKQSISWLKLRHMNIKY